MNDLTCHFRHYFGTIKSTFLSALYNSELITISQQVWYASHGSHLCYRKRLVDYTETSWRILGVCSRFRVQVSYKVRLPFLLLSDGQWIYTYSKLCNLRQMAILVCCVFFKSSLNIKFTCPSRDPGLRPSADDLLRHDFIGDLARETFQRKL